MIVADISRTRRNRSTKNSLAPPKDRQEKTDLPAYVTGKLIGVDATGHPLVTFAKSRGKHVLAKTLVTLQRSDFGRDVALIFENGDIACPAIIGFPAAHVFAPERIEGAYSAPLPLKLDSSHLLFKADRDIVLECGKASITLSKDGRIEIKGMNILSKASQTNKVKGGAVLLN